MNSSDYNYARGEDYPPSPYRLRRIAHRPVATAVVAESPPLYTVSAVPGVENGFRIHAPAGEFFNGRAAKDAVYVLDLAKSPWVFAWGVDRPVFNGLDGGMVVPESELPAEVDWASWLHAVQSWPRQNLVDSIYSGPMTSQGGRFVRVLATLTAPTSEDEPWIIEQHWEGPFSIPARWHVT